MTSDRAQSVVVTSLTIAAALAAVNEAENGNVDAIRLGVGFTLAAVGLTLLAEPAPGVAAGFALLTVTGALLTQTKALQAVGIRVSPASSTTQHAKPATVQA